MAIVGSAEMAGHLSRWDRFYLKSYESMAGHRFNFTTFSAEPNVWGASSSGRGTVSAGCARSPRPHDWLHERDGRDLVVEGPLAARLASGRAMGRRVDVRAVEGSSERMLLPAAVVDLVLTDPPYHDDVQYSELSLPLRAWALLSEDDLDGRGPGQPDERPELRGGRLRGSARRGSSARARRALRVDGHLIFSYANREPDAWIGALRRAAGRRLPRGGCELVHSENETDYAKRDVRACTLDLIIDVVPVGPALVEQWWPRELPETDEGAFLEVVAETFMELGELESGWEEAFSSRLQASPFLCSSE